MEQVRRSHGDGDEDEDDGLVLAGPTFGCREGAVGERSQFNKGSDDTAPHENKLGIEVR